MGATKIYTLWCLFWKASHYVPTSFDAWQWAKTAAMTAAAALPQRENFHLYHRRKAHQSTMAKMIKIVFDLYSVRTDKWKPGIWLYVSTISIVGKWVQRQFEQGFSFFLFCQNFQSLIHSRILPNYEICQKLGKNSLPNILVQLAFNPIFGWFLVSISQKYLISGPHDRGSFTNYVNKILACFYTPSPLVNQFTK